MFKMIASELRAVGMYLWGKNNGQNETEELEVLETCG